MTQFLEKDKITNITNITGGAGADTQFGSSAQK